MRCCVRISREGKNKRILPHAALSRRGRIEAATYDRTFCITQHHGMTVIIGEYHASLLLIACGTNSKLSCSTRSGLRRLFDSPSRFFSLAPPRINRRQLRIQEEGVSRPYFAIAATLTSVRHVKYREIAATSRYAKQFGGIRVGSENAIRNVTRVIEPSNRLLQQTFKLQTSCILQEINVPLASLVSSVRELRL